jgi:L,D-peptidoglycan transpeptidase YkuD (ErfK/YbiS/YcfS/YnhG family)
MIIVKKQGYLIFKDLKLRCSLGKNGIANKKKEGDGITPRGIFRLTKVFYREDRVKNIKTKIKKVKIKKNMGWCDDSKSKFYNKLVKIPGKFGHEKLYRKDNIYNIVVVLDYNLNPTIENKGSAIFIHVAKKNYTTTQGCLGLKQNDLIKLIRIVKKNQKIKII